MSTSIVFCRSCGSSIPLSSESTSFCCTDAQRAFQEEPNSDKRIRSPRIDGKDVSWNTAFDHMASTIDTGRKRGPNTFGIYTGQSTYLRGLDWVEALLLSVHTGTTSLFTDLCLDDASRLLVTEWMVGHATPLLSDLGRAHNILLLGDDPDVEGWGMLQPDHQYTKEIKHSQQTKHTKVTVVSATGFEPHINVQKKLTIKPGTEPFFLLGMLHLVLNNGWYDKQYVNKYTTGLDTIKQLIAPYPVSRCASICGLSDADISGVTLKWVRSAMSVIHLTPGALRCRNATLGAWAWLTLHALSANALRPGGLYESMGALDILPFLVALKTDNAPKSQVGGQPLLLGQNMSSHLLLELERGNLETLMLLDPPMTAQSDRFMKAFSALSNSIVLSDVETPLTEVASVVLPRSTPWEESDILLHRNPQFSTKCLPTSSAVHPQFGDSKSAHEILNTLSKKLSFKWTGSEVGFTNRLLAKQVQKGGQEAWIKRAWGLLNDDDINWNGSLNYQGEHNRALWRPSQDTIVLHPPQLDEMFRHVDLPKEDTDRPFVLHSSHSASATDVRIGVHPDSGFEAGQKATVSSAFGSVQGIIELNAHIAVSTILCSAHHDSVRNLLPTNTDLHTGTPVFNGVPCTVTVH